jgi:multidrug efflux pump subunit AcrB
MWIVRVALNRPYTFIVLALLILLAAPVVIMRTPTDIFPDINIPVVSIGWQYTGLNPEELEGRLTSPYEKALTTLVDNIQHIESTTYNGTVFASATSPWHSSPADYQLLGIECADFAIGNFGRGVV